MTRITANMKDTHIKIDLGVLFKFIRQIPPPVDGILIELSSPLKVVFLLSVR
jgi:hypothetical protein